MWLIIDDERNLGCDVIARTAEAGAKVLHAMSGCFECLCIDHDLGPGKSGYDVIRSSLNKGCLPKQVQIVSQNPVGAQNIRNLLMDSGYTSSDNINFFRS